MNKKDYKGYELIKAIHDGEIKNGTIIEVHDLRTLDHIKARIEYSNKRLNWITDEFDTSCLFDDYIYFRILEDNTEGIKELPNALINTEDPIVHLIEQHKKINELVKEVNSINKKIK